MWSQAVEEVFHKYKKLIGEDALWYGRAHIVWSDYNLEDSSIRWCIDECHVQCPQLFKDIDPEVDKQVIASLQELLLIPESQRWEKDEHE